MQAIQDALLPIVQTINSYLSDYILIVLLIGTGLFYSIRTRFVQVRCFGEGMKKAFGSISLNGGRQASGLSSFQALTTAIAAQVGTGNIVGACGAILIGGPGAILWMWIIAFFGMATIYSEAVLAQKTRIVHEDGTVSGGPVYYIRTAFKGKFGKFLAGFFAVAITLALGFMGTMVQSNSISEACHNAFGIPGWAVGIFLCVAAVFIFIGGIGRIGAVTEKMVPVMAVLYLVGGLVVLCVRIKYIPETFGLIFKYAFNPTAIIGGSIGYALKTAISQGVKRGLFSNEAGMGSTPHAHALANVKDPHEQGVVAMAGVFVDTFVVLTMTALVVISTLFTEGGPLYNTVLTAINGLTDFQNFSVQNIFLLLPFGFGVLTGIFGGLKLVKTMFDKAAAPTYCAISGMMLGAIPTVFPFRTVGWNLELLAGILVMIAGTLVSCVCSKNED